MADWVKVGADVGTGAAAGALGEYIAEKDDPTKKWYQQPSIYYKYGFPIASILLSAFGLIRGNWETRLITAGSTLAGGKAYHQIKAASATPYRRWTRDDELRRQREEALRRAREARERGGGGASREAIAEI